jgi:hypothetical protein
VVAVAVVGNSQPEDPTTVHREPLEPPKGLPDRAKAVAMEPEVVAVGVGKTVVLVDQLLAVTMAHSAAKMATVWLPAVVLYLAVHTVAEAE